MWLKLVFNHNKSEDGTAGTGIVWIWNIYEAYIDEQEWYPLNPAWKLMEPYYIIINNYMFYVCYIIIYYIYIYWWNELWWPYLEWWWFTWGLFYQLRIWKKTGTGMVSICGIVRIFNNQSMFELRKSKLLSVVDVSSGLCCFQLWV